MASSLDPPSYALPNLVGKFGSESVLWVVYSGIFIRSLWLLRRSNKMKTLSPLIRAVHCLLYATCTVHYFIEFHRFYEAVHITGIQGYGTDDKGQLIGADALISLSNFLGDIMLLYRCWYMYKGKYWVAALPFLTALAGDGCLVVVAYLIFADRPHGISVLPPAAIPLLTAGYALSLCTNVIASGLLVGRIWWMTRTPLAAPVGAPATAAVSAEDHPALRSTVRLARRAIAVIVESGLIYLAVQIVLVVLVSSSNNAEGIVAAIAVQLYGIAPTLIVIRVALGISTDSTGAGRRSEYVSQLEWAANSPADVETVGSVASVRESGTEGEVGESADTSEKAPTLAVDSSGDEGALKDPERQSLSGTSS
ncbi:hypothetical protein C2E23DRAFT_731263 [Lenzites betulinus]|nr:hypothetical protein C2E23DRAFT_731263 [Lenzites betulinus]